MRTVILSVMVSLDGFFEALGDQAAQLDWHRADDEWDGYAEELIDGAGILLFGRRTYEGFAAFWPTQAGEVARLLNETAKIVWSTTLAEATWERSRLVQGDVPEEVAHLNSRFAHFRPSKQDSPPP